MTTAGDQLREDARETEMHEVSEQSTPTRATLQSAAEKELTHGTDADHTTVTLNFRIAGMSCDSCAARIAQRLRSFDGVVAAEVDFSSQQATVVVAVSHIAIVADLVTCVAALGYRVANTAAPSPRMTSEDTGMALARNGSSDGSLPLLDEAKEAAPDAAATAQTQLLITGMSCGSCAARIERALGALAGVTSATVSFASMGGRVQHRPLVTSVADITRCVQDMGYEVTVQRTTAPAPQPARNNDVAATAGEYHLMISGMSCASCAARIEAALRALPSVVDSTVSFATGAATVRADDAAREELITTVEKLGYQVSLAEDLAPDAVHVKTREALERTGEIEKQRRRCIGAAVLSIPLLIAMLLMSFTNIMEDNYVLAVVIEVVQFAAATPVVLFFGRQFFVGAWRSLQHRTFTMDTLVAIGTGCSYLYSVVALATTLLTSAHTMTYFDTAGMLIAFMLLGRYLEATAKRSTSSALIALLNLVPPMATVVTASGVVRVPSADVQVGAHLRVLPGERIPVDGTLLEGYSDVDEQMITGESVPRSVKPGATLIGGTLNTTAMIVLEADKVGEDTTLSQILRIVQEAQTTKPAVQRVADQVAMYFVPIVVSFSLLVLLTWLVLGAMDAYPAGWRHGASPVGFAFSFFIATVVTACPCALGLATPTAIMVGTGVGASNGILVKSGVTLETLHRVGCVVFDKTGTLTNGKLQVVFERYIGQRREPEAARRAMHLVGLVEANSTHPIATAVATHLLAAEAKAAATAPARVTREVRAVVNHSGMGLEATVAERLNDGAPAAAAVREHRVLVGNAALMDAHNVAVPRELVELLNQRGALGQTSVIGAVDEVALVLVCLSDAPKAEALKVVRALHAQGKRTAMVTGDERRVAGHIAEQVGISAADVHAGALPASKASIVRDLQQQGYVVMFVGDGINDSPALAQADVGVALGAGTEVAVEAADAVLMRNSLVDLLNVLRLSSVTVRRIYGNFVWAFAYNIIMLPIASGMFFSFLHFQLPPVVAGAAMMLSSLSVLTSSLSIRCYSPLKESDFIGY